MNQELLVLDPKCSSSMLEPIMVVDLFYRHRQMGGWFG